MSPISVHRSSGGGNNNNNNNNNNNSPEQSYTQLPDTDLDSIGHHCDLSYCHQLDFLPFRCSSCKGTFCLDHRTETAHKCPRAGDWARARDSASASPSPSASTSSSQTQTQKPTIYNTTQCAHLTCKTLIHTLTDPGVKCPECRREYCLRHRLREGHDCKPAAAAASSARPSASSGSADTLKSMFARVRGGIASKLTANSTSGAGAGAGAAAAAAAAGKTSASAAGKRGSKPVNRAMHVNNLKRTAKGDANVPAERRVYLTVEAVASAETPSGTAPRGVFWFDARWKVGRLLDDAARRLGVENVNNRVAGEEEKLRVFHVDGGVFLEFGDAVGEKVAQGDTVVLLRGAGVMF
ncbi:AN1-type zinc finger protein [Aspergillus homomorphus CBS 101889]|uniref:AN1-type domain-containing protein n=1 Tax=Aspergillus homomorphus (strain CBS 101889) TaxID=1450537 RepID=A0A395I0R3_ASPHC|nr:hypothetical protein BO97DRAFT_404793 [Aspergillus homomorphus CBS 101889]RAL13660.1 hypothetical protein BO97DRAFT_404793 [Aspergillus homomorphus CBS 101889]